MRFSTHDSAEGRALKSFCDDFGFTENVKAPTRDGNLLDLVLSDLSTLLFTKVLPGVSDHLMVLATCNIGIDNMV